MIKVSVLTGAGMSAESGIKTFRDHDGLWEGHDVMQVASPQGWDSDKALVLDFYNQRRRQLKEVEPNLGHRQIAELEKDFDVTVITQNVDDLHERAGSTKIIHLHGELLKARSVGNDSYVVPWTENIEIGDTDPDGHQLRPHIVWFGEQVPMLDHAINDIITADIILIIGTSMQVYPAASLTTFASESAPILYVDPKPTINYELSKARMLKIFTGPASTETKKAIDFIKAYRL